MKKIVAIISVAILTACGTVKLAPPTQEDANRGASKYPGYTLAQLNGDKAVYEQTCNRCHKLKKPASRTADQWKKIVPEMAGKARKKSGGKEVIDSKSQESILRYLVTMSKKSR